MQDATELSVGQVLGAVPPEPPVGAVLSTQRLTAGEGVWQRVIVRREDGWHLVGWEGGTPMTWAHAFDSFRPLRVEEVGRG